MNKTSFKFRLLLVSLVAMTTMFSACNREPDEGNLYTFTGETIESFILKDSTLTSFNYILSRIGMDRTAAAYGQYTCFAPSNEGVAQYIDSLYNDPEAVIPHNGMTENSLEGLTDSLCTDIAKYHFANGIYSIIDMGGSGMTVTTMLGRPISTTVCTNEEQGFPIGATVLNSASYITSEDNEVINGVVHVCTKVIPRSTRLLGDTFERLDDYTIFNEALQRTGLADSITKSKKNKEWTELADHTDTNGDPLYFPKDCKIGYTVFAETDATMKANGINSFDDLVAYANRIYAGATEWYDYPREKGIAISTGNDYTNRFNCLNMFVAYHILFAAMAQDQLVFESTQPNWNYTNGGEPYDYYETMLPNTLLKIWEPQPGKNLYINRWVLNNTLTDEVASYGSAEMHPVQHPGIRIVREDIQAYNGYIHPVNGMLVYDSHVPNGVLNERLRFESTTFLVEFINNGFRYNSMNEMSAMNGGGSGARVAFPIDYFDNVVCYNGDQNKLRYNIKGAYRAYQADAFQGWGQYDLAVKMPPVPSRLYEFRLFYSPMGHGGMMQFYMGTSRNVQSMMALDVPLDVRISETDPRIGWTAFYDEDDLGIATDAAMRNRGYMRAPYGFRGHPESTSGNTTDQNCRGDGTVTLRRILTRQIFRQSDEHWFRIKSVINDDTDLKWQLDFVEFVPASVTDNDQYQEDWY